MVDSGSGDELPKSGLKLLVLLGSFALLLVAFGIVVIGALSYGIV